MLLRLVIIGFGTVGQGLAELLIEEARVPDELDIRVVGISDVEKGSVYDPGGIDLRSVLDQVVQQGRIFDHPGRFDGDALQLIAAAESNVIIEVTPTDIETAQPATSHIHAALEKGCHVITTNKGPVALHYRELAALARARDVELLFEGTVMSGTPVLSLLRESLAATRISAIRGILNGSTNHILGQMEEGVSYNEALSQAQRLGFAEANPQADVLGWDSLAKVTILATVILGARAKPVDFPCEGITELSPEDLRRARSRGRALKLISRVWRQGDDVFGSVKPEEIELVEPLGSVAGVANGVTISTDTLGELTVVGPGAGGRETGYSVLSDLLHIARRLS